MIYLVVAMVASLLVAGLVALYVAYPHRGERMPYVPWLGDALGKAADAAPVIDDGRPGGSGDSRRKHAA